MFNPKRHPLYSMLQTAWDDFKYSPFDIGWLKTAINYIFRSKIEYNQASATFLLPDKCVIAIVGDWATGTDEAIKVIDQISKYRPDILIHLGDIYYSGTKNECIHRFLNPLTDLLPKTKLYTLMGNHDMYSGGHGYYWLIDEIGQKACHFNLTNEYLNLIGLNTGYHSILEQIELNASEVTWAKSLISQKKTLLFSHHQPFSGWQTVNNIVANQLGDLTNVAAWFTGHEHRLTIYENQLGIKRHRNVGAGAVPELVKYNYFSSKIPKKHIIYGDDGIVYKHSFAMMSINKDHIVTQYLDEDNKFLFAESF